MTQRYPPPPPQLLARLVGFNFETWIVRGLSYAEDDRRFYAVSLIREFEKNSILSIELSFDEFAVFCQEHGIVRSGKGLVLEL